MLRHSLTALGGAVLLASTPALALEKIPTETGFSGFVLGGAGVTRLKSNMISGNSMTDFDLERNTSDGSPDSDTTSSAVINGKIAYTWADSKTQVFLGTNMENYLRYDLSTELGVRQGLEDNSIFNASFLFSSMATKVWRDPYDTSGNKRSDTDRTSNGIKLAWENIADSGWGVTLKQRKIELDNEQSGIEQGLSVADQRLLDREGDETSLQVKYEHNLGGGHFLVPSYQYTNYDLDGDAMANDEHLLQLSHAYFNEQWKFVTNVAYGQASYDKRNPIYNKTQDDDIYGLSFSAFYAEPFGLKDTHAVASMATYRASSNIDFYDTNITTGTLALMYSF